MKRFIATCLLFTSFLSYSTQNLVSGSKSVYPYNDIPTYTAVPEGYSAFYINHIGRHGSRYISKSKNEEIVVKVLNLANEQQQLTLSGKSLLAQVLQLIHLNKDNYGQLSELGRQDMMAIGSRVLQNNPTVFRGKHIEILSTTSQRAKDSADAFLHAFLPYYPTLTVNQQPENAETTLRFFEYSPAFEQYKNSKAIKALVKAVEKSAKTQKVSQHIAGKIFNDEFIQMLDHGIHGIDKGKLKTYEFTLALFALYQELLSFTPEMITDNHLDFEPYFTAEEKQWLTMVITTKNYLQIGPAFNTNGIQAKIAAPLLWDIIQTTDNAIHNHNIDANFRFAHVETISPLATLLELDGTRQITDQIDNYPSYWQAEKIIPMGANIQFIFYASEEPIKPILVKVLLNEREIHLPVPTQQYPYYIWNDVKRFYTEKLISLGLNDGSVPIELLKNIE